MADGLFLYKTDDSYIVKDQNDNILKQAKTSRTCSSYISRTLQSRRAAEREAIEELKAQGIL
jgi:biotin operon repressor